MIEISLVIALIIFAAHSFTWEGMIFEGVKKVIKPEWKISKPIYGCPICMTPWWGTIIYTLIFVFAGWKEWFLTIGAATGFSVICVILIYIMDYCKGRTKKPEDCCV